MRSSARSATGLTTYGSHGVANIMCKKLPAYESWLFGYMNGRPVLYL